MSGKYVQLGSIINRFADRDYDKQYGRPLKRNDLIITV